MQSLSVLLPGGTSLVGKPLQGRPVPVPSPHNKHRIERYLRLDCTALVLSKSPPHSGEASSSCRSQTSRRNFQAHEFTLQRDKQKGELKGRVLRLGPVSLLPCKLMALQIVT
ncbi:Hypothetical predicted protein [Podarcis lilfordi]|uniref:Uncharacterized protein n=1 Tax=Podarcis lilfordi TaxID=74358 RepID=A0AA35LEN3_9SAUR|nr:Hypothetical predicted protein [Podarcis lilfordi]